MKNLFSAALIVATTVSAVSQSTMTGGMLGGMRARSIGPATMGGRIADLAVVSSDPKIIYVGAASGGVWKSTNGGVTMQPVFDDFNQSIGAIAIDQARPDTVWVGTGESWTRNSTSVGDGVYRSYDGGKTWSFVGLPKSERIARIQIDPKDPRRVFVAVTGALWSDSKDRGLYRTTDGGATWENVLFTNERSGCADVVMDTTDPNVLYAAMWEFRRTPYSFASGGPGSGLYRSADGGTTWTKLTNGLPQGDLGRIAIDISPLDHTLIYANVEAAESGFYRSTDAGATWERRSTTSASSVRPFYFSRIVADPVDKNVIHKAGLNYYRSADGGASFDALGGSSHSDHHAMWIDKRDNAHILDATDGGLYESFDKAKRFRHLANLPISQFYHVSLDMRAPYYVYGGLQDNGSWFAPVRTSDGIHNADWKNVGYGDGFAVLPDATDENIIFWESQGGEAQRTDLRNGETKKVQPVASREEGKLRFNWNTPIVRSSGDPSVIFIGSQYLHRSSNRGDAWKTISPDLTTNDSTKLKQDQSGGLTVDNSSAENHCTIVTIGDAAKDADVIWVGTDDGNIQVTRNGGSTWTNVTANVGGLPAHSWVSCVEASPTDPAVAYATFDGHTRGDMTPYVYKTTDHGATWTSLVAASPDVKGYANVIRQDPVRAELLYLGTEYGLYVSFDAGAHWLPFRNAIPPVPVRDLAVHPRDHDLVIATHGRGIYVLDDLTPLRAFDPQNISAEVTMLPSRPAVRRMGVISQRFSGDGEFVGSTTDDVATIWYFLKERPLKGATEIVIKDPAGTVIRKLPASTRKGLNKVEWPLRLPPPITATSEVGFAGGSFSGPLAPEGTYTVEVHRAGTVFTGTFTVVTDPIYQHSDADRASQQELVMTLYRLQTELAITQDIVLRTRTRLDTTLAHSEGVPTGTIASMRSLRDTLDAMNKQFVNTKVGLITGEEQLREQLSGLYGQVNNYMGKPTATQRDHAAILAERVGSGTRSVESILASLLPPVNEALKAAGKSEIAVETREQTEKRLRK
ncbi:MAG: glycosyl hydrolase [Bacteroidetes bacterium]|nr:glycosyl hydrolase [Bacteroidota bacterium]